MNSGIEELDYEGICKRLDQYFESFDSSAESRAFESTIDQQLYDRLDANWSHGWDFEIQDEFFGERGLSILIQNLKLDWRPIWDWLTTQVAEMPEGAVINFEVFDNIHDSVMDNAQMVLRRIIFSDGIIEEAST